MDESSFSHGELKDYCAVVPPANLTGNLRDALRGFSFQSSSPSSLTLDGPVDGEYCQFDNTDTLKNEIVTQLILDSDLAHFNLLNQPSNSEIKLPTNINSNQFFYSQRYK